MPFALPLDEMSTPEKLSLMEALWADLSKNASALQSPDWHATVLEHFDDLEDTYLATQRLQNPGRTFSADEVKHGLDL